MRKIAPLFLVLALAVGTLGSPASASRDDTPYGREDNALGTLRWLPKNALEAPTAANRYRLVVIYDRSLDANGQPIALKAKGTFGVKIFTTSQLDLKMKAHSPFVGDLKTLSGQPGLPAQADETFAGVYGDVRDGACSKAGTSAFSAAYSTSRTFFHAGTSPYAAASGAGFCEQVTASTEVRDANGNVIGFDTTVKTHVPGFWIDFEWPTRPLPQLGGSRFMAEVWYGGVYDSSGDPGPFPNGVDTSGASKSVGSPGDYAQTVSFSATPGGTGPSCTDWGTPDQPGTWADYKVTVPPTATKVTFRLFPKGDWDLIVLDPEGTKGISGNWAGSDETLVVPASGTNNIPELIPGEFTMRACNFTGEQTILGSVTIE